MTLQEEWISLATDIRKAGLDVFATADVPITEQRTADPKVVVLELLARSLSNVKSVLTLLKDQDVVEARVITRCCLENFYWAVGVAEEKDGFVRKMVEDDMNHRRAIGQTIFGSAPDLDDTVKGRLQTFMRDSKKRFADANTLNPKQVAHLRADIGRSHIFYGHLSMDAHPSTTTLQRYLVIGHPEGDGIDVVPAIKETEVCETLEYLVLGATGVCVAANEVIGFTKGGEQFSALAARYDDLSNRTKGSKAAA